jgi:hypothetical protein
MSGPTSRRRLPAAQTAFAVVLFAALPAPALSPVALPAVALSAALAAPALLAALPAPALAAPGPAAVRTPRAHRSMAVRAKDVAHLRYVSAKGSLLVDEGRATGTVAGNMKVRLHIGATFIGTFAIHTSVGTIVGRGQAIPHGAGQYESFAGSLTATGGSGRYKKAHGRAQLYGVFNRGDYSLVIQTTGTLFY